MPPEEVQETTQQEPAPVTETPVAEDTPSPAAEETFPRKYVEELREESAKYRTRAKEYEEVFDGYPDEAKAAMLEIARDLRLNPEQAASRMVEVSRELLGDRFEDFLNDPTPKPLTQADVERMLKEKEEASAQESAIQAVQQEARDLGYKDGTPEIAELFWRAHNETEGDLNKAHDAVKAARQKVIDEYLESKREGSEKFTKPAGGGAAPGLDSESPKNFDDARKRMKARFAGMS